MWSRDSYRNDIGRGPSITEVSIAFFAGVLFEPMVPRLHGSHATPLHSRPCDVRSWASAQASRRWSVADQPLHVRAWHRGPYMNDRSTQDAAPASCGRRRDKLEKFFISACGPRRSPMGACLRCNSPPADLADDGFRPRHPKQVAPNYPTQAMSRLTSSTMAIA